MREVSNIREEKGKGREVNNMREVDNMRVRLSVFIDDLPCMSYTSKSIE